MKQLCAWGLAALATAGMVRAADVADLRSVQRIVVLGDSITYGGDYVADVECWLLRQGVAAEVLNLGLPSETASDLTAEENADHAKRHGFPRPLLSERLDRVLAATKPHVLLACFGMNDGGSLPAGEAGVQRFMAAIEKLRAAATRHGVPRVVLLTPPVQDAGPGKPVSAHDEALAQYSAALLARRADGWEVADIHGPMRAALDERRRTEPGFRFSGDGVHPGAEGHWLMACAAIRGLGGEVPPGAANAAALCADPARGAAVRKLVGQRMALRRDAWLTATGHKRPGLRAGLPVEQATAQAVVLTAQIAALMGAPGETGAAGAQAPAALPGTPRQWNGFARHDFPAGGRTVSVIVPAQPLPGRLWAWKGEFLDAFPGTEIALLKRGVHIVYLSAPNLLGAPSAVALWDACYRELTERYGFARKPALIGLSRGGLYCYNWAAANPGRVACVYADAAVCDFKSWPGGKGKGKGSAGDWQLVLKVYGFADEAAALAYKLNPVDNLKPLADAHVPLFHVYGEADDVVPWDENTGVVAERYKQLGGSITLVGKPGCGHHPHGLADPTPVVDFIVKQVQAAQAAP